MPNPNFKLALLAFLTIVATSTTQADDSYQEKFEIPEPALSHAALFAPRKDYPYFEAVNHLNPSNGKFNLETAATLAQFSMLVYVRDPEFIQKKLAEHGYTYTQVFDTAGTFAIIAADDENIVVAFRGTETANRIDYLTDMKIHLKEFNSIGKAHTGFIDAFEKVNTDLQVEVSSLMEASPRKIWITGHSLGGALSTLLGIQLGKEVEAIYPIGCPRVGNKRLIDALGDSLPIYRVVNDNDLIPRIPAPPYYHHIGPTYFITTDGELIENPEAFEKWKYHFRGHQKFIKRIWKDHWTKKDFDTIPSDYFVDHSPRLYAEALIKLATIGLADPQQLGSDGVSDEPTALGQNQLPVD